MLSLHSIGLSLFTLQLEPIFMNAFKNFLSFTVIRFRYLSYFCVFLLNLILKRIELNCEFMFVCLRRPGSIITDMSLYYTYNGGLPTNGQIIETLKTANTGFNMTDIFGKYESHIDLFKG